MNKEISKKTILIVGANGSLAKETIKHLIADGATNITMACRTESKGLAAKKEIESEISSSARTNISVVGGFDMNDPTKTKKVNFDIQENNDNDLIFLNKLKKQNNTNDTNDTNDINDINDNSYSKTINSKLDQILKNQIEILSYLKSN